MGRESRAEQGEMASLGAVTVSSRERERESKCMLLTPLVFTESFFFGNSYFRDRPLSHPLVTPEHLMYWYFEHELKQCYSSFIQVLEVMRIL